ncbi:MAG: soluble lytic murein transglycosylase [Rhodococcus erythropolis]|nr:DUF1214 domain-containing protein [Rhodococcus erythropolis]MDF2894151.1 soluble lytic murein transglycosylase [Rhodococcus erythropolis]
MAEIVTRENFVEAETAHYFREQLAKAPVNEYFHSRAPVNVETQVVIRSNVDLIYSSAVVDVSEEATFSLAASDEYQIAQIIDENHYVVGVVYPGESMTVRNVDLSAGTHVYVGGRTATVGGFERAHELQDARRITASTSRPYRGREFDEDTRKSVGAELETHAAEADFSQAFGTPTGTDPYQHLLGARLGWGGLPPSDAQYFQAAATSSGADVWTFDVPPLDYKHNGYFSVIKYDEMGWLDVERPGLSDRELVRNDDGTISVWFGDDRIADKPNVIRATEGQKFYYGMRVYRPHDVEETRQFIEKVRSMPLRPVD